MATIYSRTNNADDDLEFKLRRSLQLVKERKEQMATKKKAKAERASVSRERRLALALRGLLDSLTDAAVGDEHQEEVTIAELDATGTLNELGYKDLVGIRRRLRELNEQLKVATEAADGATIAAIGAEMVKVQAGKFVAPSATKKSSKRSGATATTQSTETNGDAALAASAGGE